MAQFESIKPTSLVERIRSGEEVDADPVLALASNLALFLRLGSRTMIDEFLHKDDREKIIPLISPSERAEIAMTGVQLAFEASMQDLTTVFERADRAIVSLNDI